MNYTINGIPISSNELYHHGILGMHWGDRNGPPYPLGMSQKSASEKAPKKYEYRSDQKSVTKNYMERER